MKRDKTRDLLRDEESWSLNEHVTRFVNAAFGRRLRPSRALYDAVRAARESGYTGDECRLAFWVARCVSGDFWIKERLTAAEIGPEIILRHKGGINNQTGKPAKRWLDDLLSRASETNPRLVSEVLIRLPEDMQDEERQLLERMDVVYDPSRMGQNHAE